MELLSEFIEFLLKAQKAQIKAQQMKDGLEKLDTLCDVYVVIYSIFQNQNNTNMYRQTLNLNFVKTDQFSEF